MNDLTTLLDRASLSEESTAVDVSGDLARGQRALSRTRRRRGAAGLAGLAAASVAGIGISRIVGADPAGLGTATEDTRTAEAGGIVLLAQPLSAGPYTFDTTPEGWVVQDESPFTAVIAPADGSAGDDPNVFTGKLVIMFDAHHPSGTLMTVDGREFWVNGDSGYTSISTDTFAGEPDGAVTVQFPKDTGWTTETMIEFLASVHVGTGAQHGHG
jgi:hypothetical protein